MPFLVEEAEGRERVCRTGGKQEGCGTMVQMGPAKACFCHVFEYHGGFIAIGAPSWLV